MKLNPNAWHARFYRWGTDEREAPQDLCSYVGGLCKASFMALWMAALVIGLPALVFYKTWQHWPDSGIGLAIVAVSIILTIAIVYPVKWASEREIIREYLKARKEKYCPRIEWDEGER